MSIKMTKVMIQASVCSMLNCSNQKKNIYPMPNLIQKVSAKAKIFQVMPNPKRKAEKMYGRSCGR